MFVDADIQAEFNPIKRSSLFLGQLFGRQFFLSMAEMQWSNWIQKKEGSEIISYIKKAPQYQNFLVPLTVNDC